MCITITTTTLKEHLCIHNKTACIWHKGITRIKAIPSLYLKRLLHLSLDIIQTSVDCLTQIRQVMLWAP